MSAFKAYERYKQSGVEWLGEVPEHWEILKTRHVFEFSKGLTITKENLQDEGIPCVSYGEIHSKYGFEVIPEKHLLKCVAETYLETDANSLLNYGDFIFADTSEDIQGSGNFSYLNSHTKTFAGYHTIIARLKHNYHHRYFAYLFESGIYRTQVRRVIKGVKVFSITQAILKDAYLWLPSLEEQTAITQFLDPKTAQIDALIAKKQQLLNKLAEQRTALISHAVTKGLNPNAPLKKSGVEWLGDVPEHWEVVGLHYLARLRSGNSITALDFQKEGDYPVYGGNGFRGYIDYHTHEGDYVLIGRQGALCGNINFASGKFFASEHAIVVNPTDEFNYKWLGLLLLTMNLNQYSVSAAQPGLSAETIGRLRLPVPPIVEQTAIAQYLDQKTAELDQMASKVKTVIQKLKEYRAALITQAVTGKIDVRAL